MTQPEPTRRRSTKLLVTVAVVAVVAAGGTWAATRDDDPAVAAPTTQPAPQQSLPPLIEYGDYDVEAGAGGSGVAVDGQTPIGYAPDCQGAVHAATNYYTAVEEALYQDRLTGEQFDALLDQINAGMDANSGPIRDLKAEFRTLREQSAAAGIAFGHPEYHPEWGVFRAASCNAEASAEIDIVTFFVGGPGAPPDLANWASGRVRVSWFEGDWRLLGIDEITPVEQNPAWTADLPVELPAPVPDEYRRTLIAAGGDGWTEYSNAP